MLNEKNRADSTESKCHSDETFYADTWRPLDSIVFEYLQVAGVTK